LNESGMTKIRTQINPSALWKWLLLSFLIGVPIGIASAVFLISLDWVTHTREASTWIIWLLPAGGLLIGLLYHYFGQDVVKGNNQLLEEFHGPKQVIPFKMAPLVFFGTLITHLFGGSAGREGTAVQMGGSIADQFSRRFGIHSIERRMILIAGISGGFASVFGTPLAGAVFAIEVMAQGKQRYHAILPALLTAVVADQTCHFIGATHTTYTIPYVPELQLNFFFWSILAGVIFGLAALSFSRTVHFFGKLFNRLFSYPPIRPVVGGIVIALVVYLMGTTKYIGLGIPTIVDSFEQHLPPYDFLIKLVLTTFTLGAGFKGGEVTPLFFIGATLGNALVLFMPLPIALLAGMGFVAVFSGATNTPLACTIMGMELFGIEAGVFIAIACFVAFFASGHGGIFSAQPTSNLHLVRRKGL
jgi:H+/Cl- antiporter ClcA